MRIGGSTFRHGTRLGFRDRYREIARPSDKICYVDHNTAGEAIDGALPSIPKVKAH